jgi:ABC-type ATPase involved in cell division
MTNLVQIINKVNSNSLVLVDELGSGTDPVEGSALAMAVLDHLYKVGAKTLASTHYSELKTYALSTEGVKNASCEFNVHTLMPTYRLIIGLPGKSNAFAISKKLGLPENILNNAQSFLSNENVDFENVISNLQRETHKLNKAREKSEQDKKEISLLKGEIIKNKRNITHIDSSKREMGIVFQNYRLLTDRNVFDNLHFVMKATGWKREEDMRKRIDEVLTITGLQNKAYKMPYELSGGQQQKLAIARALINNPEVILADEPTGNLDPTAADEIMNLFRGIVEGGCAIVMSTHNIANIGQFPSRTVRFAGGRAEEIDIDAILAMN